MTAEHGDSSLLSTGGAGFDLSDDSLDSLFSQVVSRACARIGTLASVLLIPPDITRYHSRAGFLTVIACRELAKAGIRSTVLPALGTHVPLSADERERMFPGLDSSLFRVHDWRGGITELGRIEQEWVEAAAKGAVSFDWPVQVNRLLCDGGFDLIISLGQVVPHEVIGMANHTKNLFIGTGGKEAIDKSHFAGAAYGMEKMMGRVDTPVRAMLDEGIRRFGGKLPPVLYAQTVISARSDTEAEAAGKPGG